MTTASPGWLQVLLSVLGVLGGTGGVVAAGTVLVQRRKLKADAADVISDAALSLVAPLKSRIAELETEAAADRRRAAATAGELGRVKDALHDLTRLMLRVREAILADPTASDQLRDLVRSAPGDVNGRHP